MRKPNAETIYREFADKPIRCQHCGKDLELGMLMLLELKRCVHCHQPLPQMQRRSYIKP